MNTWIAMIMFFVAGYAFAVSRACGHRIDRYKALEKELAAGSVSSEVAQARIDELKSLRRIW